MYKIKYFLSETPYSSIIIKYKYYKKILTYILFGYIITQTNWSDIQRNTFLLLGGGMYENEKNFI